MHLPQDLQLGAASSALDAEHRESQVQGEGSGLMDGRWEMGDYLLLAFGESLRGFGAMGGD